MKEQHIFRAWFYVSIIGKKNGLRWTGAEVFWLQFPSLPQTLRVILDKSLLQFSTAGTKHFGPLRPSRKWTQLLWKEQQGLSYANVMSPSTGHCAWFQLKREHPHRDRHMCFKAVLAVAGSHARAAMVGWLPATVFAMMVMEERDDDISADGGVKTDRTRATHKNQVL